VSRVQRPSPHIGLAPSDGCKNFSKDSPTLGDSTFSTIWLIPPKKLTGFSEKLYHRYVSFDKELPVKYEYGLRIQNLIAFVEVHVLRVRLL